MTIRWTLTSLQWDFVTASLNIGQLPAPLELPSHGATSSERNRLLLQARGELERMRLIRRNRLDGDLEDAIRQLQFPQVWIDTLWLPDPHAEAPVKVVAAGSEVARTVARQDHAGVVIEVPARSRTLPEAIVAELPAAQAGLSPPVMVPVAASRVPAAQPASYEAGAASVLQTGVRLTAAAEKQQVVFQDIITAPHWRVGQIAANGRDRTGGTRRTAPLRWFDNEDGRYLHIVSRSKDGREWINLQPGDARRLTQYVGRMHDSIRDNDRTCRRDAR